ncbi:MAG: isoleucine--tRNA ligase [Parvularculaceae bacterium]
MAKPEDTESADSGVDYKSTLFLPQTDFPMRAGLPKREPQWLERWARMGMYARLREAAAGQEKYILHDGQPYANGHLHMGHAFNKILKDLVVRSRQMLGFDANYVPGWDCHGLPIEWKVEEAFREKGRAKRDVPTAEFRAACRDYAAKWIDVQREEFKRYGVEGDWDDPYTTMKFASEAAIVREFFKLVDKGLVYRGSKPVMWSPVEQTALAEAEIEYHDHQSTTIWVKFPVRAALNSRTSQGSRGHLIGAHVVIWTTTPWTIPANRAICYGPELRYGLYEVTKMRSDLEFQPWSKPGDRLILADNLAESVQEAGLIAEWRRIEDVDPRGLFCKHPLNGFAGGYTFDVPLYPGDHVTDEAGTGFVHTAPGHGLEDYNIWIERHLPTTDTPVDDIPNANQENLRHRREIARDIPHTIDGLGAYTEDAPGFVGEQVIVTEGKKKGKDGGANKKVIEQLIAHDALLARGRLTHSYPHSWRSKAPVIFRNTPQWFVALGAAGTGGLRDAALGEIDKTAFTPAGGRNRIRAMVEGRPDWLVSRQRAWGVPLAIFADRNGEPLNDPAVNERILAAVEARGADAWFDTPAQEFLGDAYSANEYEKVDDILDVWFDSGSTHAFCLEARDDLRSPADLYLEGSDQHRGWFQSSLLQSCGTRGRAPFKGVLTHGFVLDEEGRKMSKSLGNVVDPAKIINQYGADILRIWTASSDYSDDLRIGDEIVGSAVDAYRKLRNTLKYLLGALDGFSAAEAVPPADMPALERLVLHRLALLDAEVRDGYAAFDFKGVWRSGFEFCSADLSAFYLDVRKDALYCDRPDALRRRAARTVMDLAFERIVAWLAPIAVFTAEEAFLARRGLAVDEADPTLSVHLTTFPETPAEWRDDALAERWAALRRARRVVNGALEAARRDKLIGAGLEAAPTVYAEDPALAELLEATNEAGDGLAELFITSHADVERGAGPAEAFRLDDVAGLAVVIRKATADKCARCWRYVADVGAAPGHPTACARCADAADAAFARQEKGAA